MPASPALNPNPPPRGPRLVSAWWRALAIALLLVLLVGAAASLSMLEQLRAQIGHLQSRLVQLPQIRQLAVLLDQAQRPALLVTHDPAGGVLQLQRLNEVKEGREDSLQLWALADGQSPRSLGVITSRYKTSQLPVADAALAGVAQLAISVEDKGGAAGGRGPSLPYLFRGWLVIKAI